MRSRPAPVRVPPTLRGEAHSLSSIARLLGRKPLLAGLCLLFLAGLAGCGDQGDLEIVVRGLGFTPTSLGCHRSMNSRQGWAAIEYSGPAAAIASSAAAGAPFDLGFALGSADDLEGTRGEEMLFRSMLGSDPSLADLRPRLSAGMSAWTISSGTGPFPVSGGGRIRVSHLLWDPAASRLYLLYAYLYG